MIVYWVRIAEIGRTKNRKPTLEVEPPKIPGVVDGRGEDVLKLACCSGIRNRIAMTIAAPATCHHTETLLMTASRCDEKMLMVAESARMTTKMMNVLVRL